MRGKKAKALRKIAERMTIEKPAKKLGWIKGSRQRIHHVDTTRAVYKAMKKDALRPKK